MATRMRDFIDETLLLQNYEGVPLFGDDTDANVLKLANKALVEVSEKLRSIRLIHETRINEGQASYGIPPNFNSVQVALFKYPWGIRPLRQIRIKIAEMWNSPQYSQIYPYTYFVDTNAAVEKVTEGTVVAVMVDTNAFMVLEGRYNNILPGDYITNLSDKNSVDRVIAFSHDPSRTGFADTSIEYSHLTGGTRGMAEVGDKIRITSPHASQKAITLAPVPQKDDADGDESLRLFMTMKHRKVTQSDIDNQNDFLEIDSELIAASQWRLAYWIYNATKGFDDNSTLRAKANFMEELKAQTPLVNSRHEQAINTFMEQVGDSNWFFPTDITGIPEHYGADPYSGRIIG
jgi:hypothetical protein